MERAALLGFFRSALQPRWPVVEREGRSAKWVKRQMKLASVVGRTVIVVISVFSSPLQASYGPFSLREFQTRAAFS